MLSILSYPVSDRRCMVLSKIKLWKIPSLDSMIAKHIQSPVMFFKSFVFAMHVDQVLRERHRLFACINTRIREVLPLLGLLHRTRMLVLSYSVSFESLMYPSSVAMPVRKQYCVQDHTLMFFLFIKWHSIGKLARKVQYEFCFGQ